MQKQIDMMSQILQKNNNGYHILEGAKKKKNPEDLNSNKGNSSHVLIAINSCPDAWIIDSGASNSIISPKPAFEKFKNFMFKENFRVSTIRNTIQNDDNVCYPILKELGIDYPIQFCVVDWHNHFDALIGSEDLQNLNAKIDYQDNTLKIGNTCIPFILGYTSRKVAPQKIKTTNILKKYKVII